ncbi:MAG: 50S ribosomal protein L23 [Candidatus Staskawiczbacteria bacterium]|nr:50S ribosomal protein L23 [Candidatus Staskawiczbacteria bacterium]
MALLDFLKSKEEIEKSKKTVKKAEKVSVVKPAVKTEVKKIEKKGPFSYEAIKRPHISEKASYLSEKDQYIFEVSPNYNKNEIKRSVEGIYGVNVLSVNVIKIPAKKRRLGKTQGFRKAYKKAVVTIKNGQKIEIL